MLRSDLLLALSDELSALGASTSALQTTMGEILDGTVGSRQSGFWHMQEIDRLQQTLDDLSAILRAAAEDEGARVDVERLARVARLGALRERLRRQAGGAATGQDAGIVAIF